MATVRIDVGLRVEVDAGAEDVLADGELLGSLRTLAADVHLEGAESVDAYAVATLKLLLHHL